MQSPVHGDPGLSDSELLERLRRRDDGAMVTVFYRYSSLVYLIAFRVLHNQADSEDIAQEILLQLWSDPSRYRASGSLASWLTVVTRHRATDFIRRARRFEDIEEIASMAKSNVFKEVETRMQTEAVLNVLEQLPFKQRQAIRLAFCHDLTYPEIAEFIGVPLGTVKTRIRNGLASIRSLVYA